MRRFDRIVFDSRQSDAKKHRPRHNLIAHILFQSILRYTLRPDTSDFAATTRRFLHSDRAALRPIVRTTLNYHIKIARGLLTHTRVRDARGR